MTFDNPAVQRAARRSGALAGLGLFWVTLLVSLGLIWLALGAVVATVVGVAVLLGATWHPHVDVRRRRKALGRRVKAVDEAIGRKLMAGGVHARAATRDLGLLEAPREGRRRGDRARADGRRRRTRAATRASAYWTGRAGARSGARRRRGEVSVLGNHRGAAAAAGTKVASTKTVTGATAAREWARSHPLPRPELQGAPAPRGDDVRGRPRPQARAPPAPPPRAGARLAHESVVARREGRVDDAVAVGREAVEAFREADDRRGEALALNTLALALAQDHRYAEAVEALDGAITLLGELGDRHREGTVLVQPRHPAPPGRRRRVGALLLAQGARAARSCLARVARDRAAPARLIAARKRAHGVLELRPDRGGDIHGPMDAQASRRCTRRPGRPASLGVPRLHRGALVRGGERGEHGVARVDVPPIFALDDRRLVAFGAPPEVAPHRIDRLPAELAGEPRLARRRYSSANGGPAR